MRTNRLILIPCLTLVTLLLLAGVALPQDMPSPIADSEGDLIGTIITSIQSGNYRLLVAAVLSLLMLLAKRFKVRELSIFAGDRGGAILVMLMALAGAFATILATPVQLSLNTILSAVSIAFTAVGGFTWIKRVISPQPSATE